MMGDQRQDLVDRYVASKMSLKVGGIAKVRKRVWYAKFKGLFEMLDLEWSQTWWFAVWVCWNRRSIRE